MTRINTNVASLLSQRVLRGNSRELNVALERLSTGLRINRGKDDPAGLIASENLRSEKVALAAAIGNSQRADQVVNIAEGGLTEISSILQELQGLITTTANDAGLSTEEREANQLQIDSILQTIDRVAAATSFQGLKLLNGNLDYTTQNVSANVDAFRVNGAKLGFGQTLDVNVLVTGSAQVGGFFLSFGANNLDLGGAGASNGANNQFIIEIAGAEGSRELSFSSGATLADITTAINTFTAVTGVKASVSNTTGIRLESADFGSDEFVSVKVSDDGNIGAASAIGVYDFVSGNALAADPDSGGTNTPLSTFGSVTAQNGVTDAGLDVQATVNGIIATSKGTELSINTDFLDVEIDLVYNTGSSDPNASKLGLVAAFQITGGGADFMLAPRVDIGGKVSLGIKDVAVRNVGRATVDVSGTLNTYFLADLATGRDLNLVDGNLEGAQEVVGKAIQELGALRGRLGAFQRNTIGATIRSLGVSLENTTAAESVIRDADFAAETSQLTRGQILVQSATNVLGLSNSQPQAVLQLLG